MTRRSILRLLRAALPLLLLFLALPAAGETRRLAVLVGHNVGSGTRPALRYAETDAGKLAHVLTELGGIAPDDLFLLQGRGLRALQEVLDQVARRVASWRAEPGVRVVLLFYFSGHSDGEALELNRERLAFVTLRQWLGDTGADVRLAIVDSCHSGALLGVKGGRPGPAFDIRMADELASAGQVLLTSSAEDELALESRDIQGSFFTHHLVSGLRGAADSSGDGRVTLAEAYQYAYVHTVSATTSTFIGGQHPVYDYRLTGQGELVLTQLDAPGAMLAPPPGHERALVVHPLRDQVLAELPPGAVPRLALVPGRYLVRAWRAGRAYAGFVHVAGGQTRQVRWEELAVEDARFALAKGGATVPSAPAGAPALPLRLGLAGGVRRAVARGLSPLPLLHVSLQGRSPTGPLLALEVGSAGRGAVREEQMQLLLGHRWGIAWGSLSANAGAEVAGQLIRQSLDGQVRGWSLSPSMGPSAGVTWRLTPRLSVELEARLPLTALRRDEVLGLQLLPGASVGVSLSPW